MQRLCSVGQCHKPMHVLLVNTSPQANDFRVLIIGGAWSKITKLPVQGPWSVATVCGNPSNFRYQKITYIPTMYDWLTPHASRLRSLYGPRRPRPSSKLEPTWLPGVLSLDRSGSSIGDNFSSIGDNFND